MTAGRKGGDAGPFDERSREEAPVGGHRQASTDQKACTLTVGCDAYGRGKLQRTSLAKRVSEAVPSAFAAPDQERGADGRGEADEAHPDAEVARPLTSEEARHEVVQ